MAVTTPEYLDLINELTKRKNQAVNEATAQAQGEAQRRGLVNQTGTSDIEMSLRGARTSPIEQSYQTTIAQTLQNLADQEAARKYQTSERLGSQQFQTGERTGSQDWQANQNKANQAFQTGERLGTQAYGTSERIGAQDWQKIMTENAQKYGTGERQAAQAFEGAMNMQNQRFQSAENQKERDRLYQTLISTQDWNAQQAALDRAAQMGLSQAEIKNMQDLAAKASADWWKTVLGQVAGGVAGSLPQWWNNTPAVTR